MLLVLFVVMMVFMVEIGRSRSGPARPGIITPDQGLGQLKDPQNVKVLA
jgi:hypothetical protein